MLARRNRFFAAAALTAALSTALLTIGDAVDVNRLSGETLVGGYLASAVIFTASQAIATTGWALVATAFADVVDWPRLRLGSAVAAASYVAFFVGSVYRLIAILSSAHNTHYRHAAVASAVAALALGLAACVAVSGFTARNRGANRASRLWLGGILAVISFLATALGQIFLQDYWSDFSAPSEITSGTTILAVGTFAAAIGAVVFVRGVRRPLARREEIVVGAASVLAAATLLVAAGEALIATAYDTAWEPASVIADTWLGVAARVTFAVAIALIALGARSVVDLG